MVSFTVVPIFLTIVVASGLVQDPAGDRPSKEAWETQQAQKKTATSAKDARQSKMSAVGKAVDLLTKLQEKVRAEGETEAKSYAEFCVWCDSTRKEKSEEIRKGQDFENELNGEIGNLQADRVIADENIKTCEETIKAAEDDMRSLEQRREETNAQYKKDEADVRGAREACHAAVATIKSGKVASLAQLEELKSRLIAIRQDPPQNEVSMQSYNFKSGDAIATLEKLCADFTDTHNEVKSTEVQSKSLHDSAMQDQTRIVRVQTKKLEDERKTRAQKVQDIASASQRLATVSATLRDDHQYLSQANELCEMKGRTYKQRTDMRLGELATLTEARGIVQGAVTDQTSSSTIRLAQEGMNLRLAEVVAASPRAMEAIEAEAEASESFIQMSSVMKRASPHRVLSAPTHAGVTDEEARNNAIAALLHDSGIKLKSSILTSLASKISNDPLAKVKQMIQDMIEHLLKEESTENNEKANCDKDLSEAKQQRDYAAEEIASLNANMAKLEARIRTLTAQDDQLTMDLKEDNDAKTEAEKTREADSSANRETIAEADTGLTAVNSVIDLLDKFYKTSKIAASKAIDEEVQDHKENKSEMIDAPDAGFDVGETYGGAQGSSTGILGMLDVMKSDFKRTISETKAEEKEARDEHLKFMTKIGESIAQKTEAQTQTQTYKTDASSEHSLAKDDLGTQNGKLKSQISALLILWPKCVDTGMSYEERVARREDEIESLKKAMCIFENFKDGDIGNC